MQLKYVVEYPNLPKYRGIDEYLCIGVFPQLTNSRALLPDATLFDTPSAADQAVKSFPESTSKGHGPARIRTCEVEVKITRRLL